MFIFFHTDNFPSPEDWDNEEYTGSLSDTKVFTPSNVGGDATANDSLASLTVNNSSTDPSLPSSSAVNSTNLNYAQVCSNSVTRLFVPCLEAGFAVGAYLFLIYPNFFIELNLFYRVQLLVEPCQQHKHST